LKKLGLTIFAAAVLVFPLCAQEATFRVYIPFEFSILSTTVPPGTYDIRLLNGPLVQLEVGSDRYFFHVNTLYSSQHQPKLVFHRYENRYFLSQIITRSSSRDVPMSQVERELKKQTVAAARQIQPDILLAMR
jgi:hypothetical protein